MNRKYNLKLDLQFRCNNSIMKFNQFDNNTSDFFIRITNSGKLVDIEKAIVVLAIIKPSGKVASQFVEIENGLVYADLKPNMRDEIGTYTAKAMLILEDERVVTESISYEVEEDKIFSLLNDTVEDTEDFTLLTDMLSRLSTIEISEEQRMINEAERILSEENRKIEEAKRVEAELIRQHEEADRAKYDATRESNENIRKQNESIRLANETNRIDEEAKRVEEENKRKLAEEERNANYNFMTEDEERRRSEANAHKEAENLRVQAETNRVNEEAKRRTTEQARISAENTRVSNENTRKANETTRQTNETHRVEAETQRQNRYNSFILEAEANANNFENYTNSAKVKEEERKSNELDRKSQEDRRVSNEVERISNENTRKANEEAREKNETSRQNIFENKVDEVDTKISELNTTKDNFVSSVNTKVDSKISELDNAKSDMTNTVSNKVNEVETRFNALTSSQQQDAEVIDARVDFKGVVFDSLKERIDYTDKLLRDSTVSTVTTESDFTTVEATSNGYFEDVKLEGKTLVNVLRLGGNWFEQETTLQTDSIVAVGLSYHTKSRDLSLLKSNTVYTVIPFVDYTVVKKGTLYLQLNTEINGVQNSIFRLKEDTFNKPTRIEINELTNKKTHHLFIGGANCEYKFKDVKILILEGDHTQNPPSYFEGLKSVGQDVEEIVVESVNENLFNGDLINGYVNSADINDLTGDVNVYKSIKAICSSGEYTFKFPKPVNVIRSVIGNTFSTLNDANNITEYSVKIDSPCIVVISFRDATSITTVWDNSPIALFKGTTPKPYTPHQSDKKHLLYYNNETQTWEKPILREWDSIEKHSDGKYYYHQRSGEVVLNGSESWVHFSGALSDVYHMNLQLQDIIKDSDGNRVKIICDKFKARMATGMNDDNTEFISVSNSGIIRLSINKSKASDLSMAKQWLQANPVTVVYQLAEEKVYECTNIDLITYANETNYVVNCGAIVPKSTLKVHNNISNVVNLLQKKVSLLESNIKASQEVQDMMILETDMRMLDIELALMEFMPMTLNLGGSDMLRSATYFNFLKNHIINETYEKEYLENVMNKYLATGRINQDEYDELYKMLYPPVYDIELPIEY